MATTPAKATFPLILEDTYVRQDEQGRFSLNDLHQAAGGEQRHQPRYWLENKQTQALVAELENSGIPLVSGNSPDLASATPSNCADLHSLMVSPTPDLASCQKLAEFRYFPVPLPTPAFAYFPANSGVGGAARHPPPDANR